MSVNRMCFGGKSPCDLSKISPKKTKRRESAQENTQKGSKSQACFDRRIEVERGGLFSRELGEDRLLKRLSSEESIDRDSHCRSDGEVVVIGGAFDRR